MATICSVGGRGIAGCGLWRHHSWAVGRGHRARGRRDALGRDRPAPAGGRLEGGRDGCVDRMRIQTAGEGNPVPASVGTDAGAGHCIWAGPLVEVRKKQGGGKGSAPSAANVSYRLSFALALCEGPVLGAGRVWADGEEVSADDLNMRVYPGDEEQLPDPAISAQEGESAPAYRGIADVCHRGSGAGEMGQSCSATVIRGHARGQGRSRSFARGAGRCDDPRHGRVFAGDYFGQLLHGHGRDAGHQPQRPIAVTGFQASMQILGRELPRVGSVSLVLFVRSAVRDAPCGQGRGCIARRL